ncbi:Disintegrin and metalloproteinase domain-containing protein 9 [Varanus komodoensis]|nr:Disintegrin and metalloproteinase domain-containing protein 9 [Varanus komodoensis]
METFSVILAQLLGLALGMEYDDGKNCACPGPVCVMNTAAVHSSGVKAFSSCSIEDFQNFIKFKTPNCLSNRPNLKLYYKKKTAKGSSFCGNGVVEPGEKCDCGSAEFKPRNVVCRPAVDGACDLPEYCNGSAASCPADVHVQNGFQCASNTGFCYGGSCQSPDLHCQDLFGKRSRNAPHMCYEEVNSQADRFGHCGTDGRMKGTVCISLDLKQPEGASDPMLVKEGTKCGVEKVCIKQVCEKHSILRYDCDPGKKCSGHGLCNSKKNCHCHPGWAPPNCKERGSPLGGSVDSGVRILESDLTERAAEDSMRRWILLSIFLFLPLLAGSAFLAIRWKRIAKYCTEEPETQDDSESYSRSEELSMSDRTSTSTHPDMT